MAKSDFLCSAHFSLDKRDDIGYSYSVGLGRRSSLPVRYARKSSFVFVRSSCLWFLPQSTVEKSRSQRVEELGSQPSTPSFGLQLGETVGHSWTSRLVDFPTPELSERTGRHDSEKTQNTTNEASMLLKTQSALENELKTNPKRSQFEHPRRELKPNSEVARLDGEETPHPAQLLSPPSPISGVSMASDPNRTRNRTPQGRGLLGHAVGGGVGW